MITFRLRDAPNGTVTYMVRRGVYQESAFISEEIHIPDQATGELETSVHFYDDRGAEIQSTGAPVSMNPGDVFEVSWVGRGFRWIGNIPTPQMPTRPSQIGAGILVVGAIIIGVILLFSKKGK